MNEPLNSIPFMSIHPDKINLYSLPISRQSTFRKNNKFDITSVSNIHTDLISAHTARKVSKAISYLLFMAQTKSLPDTFHGKSFKFKISFITLTLPSTQVHTDTVIKKECLNQFLIELSHRFKVTHYIWRAEKQLNGNIHFHILVNKFIPWSELRDRWNRITNKLGYVDRYRDQMRQFHSGGFQVRKDLLSKWEYKKQIKAYQHGKANDWNSPNSTDVHSLKEISNIKNYLIKYCSKSEQNKSLIGRIWGCDYALTDIKGAQVIADSALKSEINELLKVFKPKVYSGEYFTVITISIHELYHLQNKLIFKLFSDYLIKNFNFHYQT